MKVKTTKTYLTDAKTGTQGLKNAVERGIIPPAIFNEIFEAINDENDD